MKKKLVANILITFSLLLVFASSSAAKSMPLKEHQSGRARAPKTVSSSELVEKNRFFNGKTVWYQGEVIGDIMVRRNLAWLTVNDDAYSRQASKIKLKGYNSGLSVTVPKRLSEQIKFVGNYKQRGDIVLIKALFHNACPQHNGVLMLHGQSLKVIKRGFALKHPISPLKLRLASFSFLLFILAAVVYYLKTPALKRRWFSVFSR